MRHVRILDEEGAVQAEMSGAGVQKAQYPLILRIVGFRVWVYWVLEYHTLILFWGPVT